MTVNGRTIWDNVREAENFNTEVIRPFDQPLTANGGISVLRGNLAPDGAVLKPSAASPELMQHRGRGMGPLRANRDHLANGKAVGIEFWQGERLCFAKADAEVILSAGAIGSPRQPHRTVRSFGTGEKQTP